MTLLQLLNQEFIQPENGWSFCFSHLTAMLHHGHDTEDLIANMLLLKQLAGIQNNKWKGRPGDKGYTRRLV